MSMPMVPAFPRRCSLAVAIGLYAASATAAVDDMPWMTVGSLEATAKFQGKSVKLVQKTEGPWTARFAMDGMFSLTGKSLELTGTWSQEKAKFKVQLDAATVRTLLSGIERDLAAQSRLRVELEPKSATFSGTEKTRSNTLHGTLTVHADLRYPDYSAKTGGLTITYRFAANGGM